MNTNFKILLSILFLFFSYSKSFSQTQTEWVQRFNSPGNYNDYVTDMAIDKSGNIFLTGYVHVNDTDQNFVTIKYNTQGGEQWVRYYDGPDHREVKPVAIAVDDSGNVFVTGYSYSYSEFDDILIIRYNENGDSIWTRKFLGIGHVSDRPNAMALDKNGNVIISGSAVGINSMDALTMKYNSNGNFEWSRYFDGITNGYDVSYGLAVDKNNIIYIIGGVTGKGGIIIKYDSAGNQFLPIVFPTFAPNKKILLDDSINIFLGFDSYGGISIRYDIGVAKVDATGTVIWTRTYHKSSTNNNDYINDMCLDRFGNVTVTGVSGDSGELSWDIATIKYNNNGDTLWINRYNPAHNSNDVPSAIVSDKYGNTYLTGASDSGLFAKMITIKYSPAGVRDWIAYYNNSNPFTWHSGAKIIADTSGSLYVSGRSQNNIGDVDIVTIKYSALTNLSTAPGSVPNQFRLYQNYSNPFNPVTHLEFWIPDLGFVSLKVYDLLGKEVKTLVNEIKPAGIYSVEFDGSDLPSGIYYYKLVVSLSNPIESGNFTQVRKMILVK